MPKSSIARSTPSAFSASSSSIASSKLSISAVSVISSVSPVASSCDSASASATSWTRPGSRSWAPETFTPMPSPGWPGYFARQSAPWWHAFLSTHRPSSPISPLSSASGTKLSGITIPRVGWRQRTSASTPVDRAALRG